MKAHYRAIFETKEKIKSILDKLNQENDVIYVLMCNDEMNEILTIAVNEFKSDNSKANIKMLHSIVDVDMKGYKSGILLHMIINEDITNEYKSIRKLETLNLVEML